MLLSTLAEKIGATLTGGDVEFLNVSTDTRSIQPGDLFVALKGERFDAHDFVAQALDAGAVAAMVSRMVKTEKPIVQVDDTRLGLGQLGKAWLQQFDVKKIAITGSSGKTSVKEMVAAILACEGETLVTAGNLNNDIGVPLTLCKLRQKHQYAVIEMGANHVGEIAYVSELVRPHISLVNNVGPAHLEGFGSIENVAKAKGEIYENLADGGTAIINIDDQHAPYFKTLAAGHTVKAFSMSQDADVMLDSLQADTSGRYSFTASVDGESVSIRLPLLGLHNVSNALAAMAVSIAAGASAQSLKKGLEALQPVKGRLCPVMEIESLHVIDDSYNANPASIKSAIDILGGLDVETVLVLGDMAELGSDAAQQHEQVGQYAAQQGIKKLYVLGQFADAYGKGFQQAENGAFEKADSYEQLANMLSQQEQGKTVLIKGSRSSAMEKVIHCLMNLENHKEESL